MFYRADAERPSDRLRRARPVIALAAVAFAIGVIVGAGHGPSARDRLAASFVGAWAKRDYARMYLDLDVGSRRAISAGAFAEGYQRALRTATATRRGELEALGLPAEAMVGVSGLERAFDGRLLGAPGGRLLASGRAPGSAGRVLASAAPRPAPAVRTTVSPQLQRAVVLALGG